MKIASEQKIVPKSSLIFLRTIHLLTTRMFGTGFGLASKLIMPLVRDKNMEVHYRDGSKFAFKINDNYWNRLAFKDYVYEQEIEYFLDKVRSVDYVFLDCGANYGYWSVLASSELFGKKEVVAVEASPATYKLLSDNCRANNNRFIILNNALFSSIGQKFYIDSSESHAATSIKTASDGESNAVESVTLDHIHSEHVQNPMLPLIVKLDVEGQEINTLNGAQKLIQKDALFIYEDHAQEVDHKVTSHVLTELNMTVFYIDESNKVVEIKQAEELEKIKVSPTKGYNFFACKADSCFMPYFAQS